jgi:predicted adenine nucleotide alpha hydrolase (AANH) superfamily ATPase
MFLHTCCAPCLATALATLRGTTAEQPARVFFYNPNIHPLLEFRRRVKALRLYLERDPLQAEIDDSYGLPEYLAAVLNPDGSIPEREERCRRCYALRLGKAAEVAASTGFAEFTSTLLASREQDRGLVAEEGEKAAARHGISFIRADLREILPPEKLLRGIYKQQYCGCIFSEEERYRNTKKHLYRFGDQDDIELEEG